MKKSILLLFAALLPLVASAEKVQIDGIWYNLDVNTKQAEVTFKGDDPYQGGWYSGSITIPATVTRNGVEYSVTSIGYRAFAGCSSLTAITIPEGVTSIGDYAFCNCSSLTAITTPESVTSIGEGAFEICRSLTAITIPENSQLTSIGDYAFYDCSSLTAITIPEGVTSIGNYAFGDCSSLTAITIPKNSQLTSIGNYAFYGCSCLTAITCEATTPPTIGGSETFNGVDKSIPVYVPAGSVAAYQMAEGWSDFKRFEAIKTSVSNITLSQSSITLTEGASITLTAIVTPEDADETSVTWSSSNEDVVMVSSKCKVIALAAGTATITATANDGSGVSASCEVTVTPASYVITFLIDGEQFYTQTLTRGSTITLPEAPTKEGHTFNGWGDVAETMPAHDVTYEGSYSINSYTLTYVVDGEVVLTLPILYGGSIPSLKEPAKEGYTFSGWSEIPETMPANDVTIEGTFTQLPSVFLIINQAENGCVKQHLTAGTVCTITIEAAEGWKIHSVTFNGEDVTSQLEEGSIYTTPEMLEDAVLNIAYEQEVPESVENAHARAIKVRGLDNTIHISGLAEGTEVTLYTTDGAMVAHQQSSAGEAKFTVDTNQVYIVKVADKVVKIGM